MAENHVREDASAGEDGGGNSYDAVTEGAADSVNQMDPTIPSNGPGLDSQKETRAAEDMFVDCPDEIETSESQQSSEEKDILQNDQTNELDSEIKVQQVVAEIELLRDKLDKSVSEKQEYEEERAMFMSQFSQLCSQLKVSSEQLIPADENADGFEVGSSTSLHDMISECSRHVKYTEEKVQELHSVLYMKDQEIDFLNAKVADLTESTNVSQSNSISEHDKLSQLYEVQLEKDQLIEEITNRILASLTTVHHQEQLWDGSLTEKISNIERSVTLLVEKYNLFVSESDQLKECLNEAGLDLNKIDEVGTFLIARDKILELRRKEEDTYQNLSSLGDENRKLVEELEKQKSTIENMKAEIRRLNAEVEQEQKRYANTKEKLSMAVTKGKALVQQRDSLKQSLLEKTSQFERCSSELQEKTSALDAAEKTKELLAESEKMAAFLQDSLAEKEMILQKCGEILLKSFANNEQQTTDDITEKLIWLADEHKSLSDISHKLSDTLNLSKEEAARLQSEIVETKEAAEKEIEHLTTSLLAEIQDRRYLEVELEDIRSKGERLQHELAQAREFVNNEIDRLTSSLLAESQEKNYLQLELENLSHKYEGVIEKENLASMEKDKIVSMLLEASGLAPQTSDTGTIIDNCLEKIRENACPTEPSLVEMEIFESIKNLLYIRDQEMTLYKLIIEEDILDRAHLGHLSDELEMRTHELNTVKDEKAVVQRSLEQLEERCALLKEKLSMAVKKGKGLVQDRENLKGSLSEKNSEIDSLKSELQQHVSRYAECQDEITKLLVDVERISVLETDLTSTKERRDQLEQFLSESNSMLQIVVESIEAVNSPADLFFNDPVEKVKWISGYLIENEILKTQMEQELRSVKDEVISSASKLSEVQMMMKSLKDSLSTAENSRSELLDEKKALEVSKGRLEEELHKEKESVSSRTREFEELLVRKRALEDALSLAEENASRFISEREAAEGQIKKLTEELSDHIAKVADAEKTIQSLDEALSQAQKNISIISDESSKVQIGQVDLEGEIVRIKEEADAYASKLYDASTTIKSLENNISELVQEKKNAQQELVSCMEELAGIRSSKETQSLELSDQLSRLQRLLEDETLSTLVGKCFQKKCESLKSIEFQLKEMWDCFLDIDSDVLQNSLVMEDASLSTTSPFNSDVAASMERLNDEVNVVDTESVMIHFEKMVERFHLKGKTLADKFDHLSTLVDESIATLLRRLHVIKEKMIDATKYTSSLKDQLKDIQTDKKRQDDTIASLESDIRILLSACMDATQGLEMNVHKNVSELRSIHEFVNQDDGISMDLGEVENDAASALSTDHVKKAEQLLLATRQNQDLSKVFQEAINKLVSMTEDMRNKLKETQVTYDEVMEERDLCKDKILKLEADLIAQHKLYNEMEIKLEEYMEREDEFRTREAELSISSKVDDTLSPSEVKSILDKMNQVNIPDAALAHENSLDSADARKLFYVIDSFSESLNKVSSLSHENEELQSTIDQQILEIEQLRRQVEDYLDKDMEKDSEKLSEFESRLQIIVEKLGGGDLMYDSKVDELISLVDKVVTARLVESESLKLKNGELGDKLLGAQKAVDDLSNKVKLLEESNQSRAVVPEIDQEREISLSSLSIQPEISEMQEMGALGKSNNIPSAAHVRTLRKSSSDHLAINIESESERLINDTGSDEDKGHVFKSLIGTGLIPRQGRTVADRIDGVWVSSSQALMKHPRGRLGVVVYWLVLHIWLLASIL